MKRDRPTKDFTWSDLAEKIDSEGFDYYFSSYESPENFIDAGLRNLARAYCKASSELQGYLKIKGGIL